MWFFKEFFEYLRVRKKYWLIPIFVILLTLGAVVFLGQGTPAIAPFIYTVF
jgi:hypothetical protein|tara:strand:- start:482 stop:634 length:153 start_codon:yes stop_codon:yes gene_type:complete